MYTRWSMPVLNRGTPKTTSISCPACHKVMGELPDGKTIARSTSGGTSYLHLGCECGHKQKIGIEDVTKRAT